MGAAGFFYCCWSISKNGERGQDDGVLGVPVALAEAYASLNELIIFITIALRLA
jgi:hypothetical protein